MKLNNAERVVLQQILPKEGDIVTVKIVRDLYDTLGFSEEEVEASNIRVEDDMVKWDRSPEKDIEFGHTTYLLVVDTLRNLNNEKKLTAQHISLYEKFVEGAGEQKGVEVTNGELDTKEP